MLPNRKNLMKKSLNTAGSAGIKRPSQPIPSNAKKQRLEFPKQGISASGSASTSAASSGTLNRIVELDTTWQDSVKKDMNLTAKEFQLMLKANRDQGKIPKAFCIAIKNLLKTDEGTSLDVDLFKEVLQSLTKEEDAKKSPLVFGAIFSLLNKLETHATAMNMSVLPAALQMLRSVEEWPATLLNYVLFDSMGLRLWVDKPEATVVQLAAFSIFGEVAIPGDEMFQSISDQTMFIKDVPREPPKYALTSEQKTALFKSTMIILEKALESGLAKPLLRTLCLLCANEEFRLLATQKLDFWLANTKYLRHAQELLLFIACNIRSLTSKADMEILLLLSKLRLQKSRPVQNVFQRAIKEIVTNCPESLPILTEFIVENDLTSSPKAQNNIGFLQFLFTQNPGEVLKLVAKRLIKRLENQDQLKQVRLFFKEFYRSLQGAYFSQFSSALFEALKSYNGPHTVPVFQGCLDLFAMLPFLAISPVIRDAAQIRRNSGNLSTAQTNVLDRFQQQFQRFTLEAISAIKWANQNFRVDPTMFVDSLHIVLYLRPYQSYAADNWITEIDFNNATRIMFECEIDEKLISTLIEIRSETVSSAEILQVIKSLTMRAIQSGVDLCSNRGGINIKNPETIAKLFNLSINSQKDAFVAAKLADYELYWCCWELTFCLSCMSSSLIKSLYQSYPILRMLFAMAIAGEFNFPPQHFDGLTADQLFKTNTEQRNVELIAIRQAILKDQQKNDGIKDGNIRTDPASLKLTLMNPSGPVRQPPKNFLKQLRQLNEQYPFNINLCQVNDPDILARVCVDLGPHHILPTVITYLTSKPTQIEVVPLICVCQLYLVIVCQQNSLPIDTLVNSSTKLFISAELQDSISKLIKAYLKDETRPLDKCQTVVEFLVAKLGASLSDERDAACIGLCKILSPETTTALDFDPNLLKNVAHFTEFKENICSMMATACTIEKRSVLITKYLQFIVENIDENSMHRIASRNCASFSAIVERSNSSSEEHKTIRRNLVKFFADFMRKLIESGGSKSSHLTSPPSAHHDKLNVRLTYPKEIQVEIDANIVKAVMELLSESFGDYEKSSVEYKAREYLMNVWFPASTKLTVTLSHDPSTPVDILPEALRMRMLSARDERIVKVALNDVTPEQAVRYIQTFALSSFSCTELLRILNKSSIPKTPSAQEAIPFVRAYTHCEGADQFLKAAQQNTNEEVKMEVDSNGPALFIPVKPPSFFEEDAVADGDSAFERKQIPTFDSVQSLSDYLNKIINDPDSKEQTFTMSTNWIQLLKTLRNKLDMAKEAVKFLQTNLKQLEQEYPSILCSLLSCINGHTDPAYKQLSTNLLNEIKPSLSGNQNLASLVKSFSRTQIKKTNVRSPLNDVDMRPKLEKENEKLGPVEEDEKSNPDLRMHWKLAEYFEAVLNQASNPQTKVLVRQLRQAVTEHIQNEPTVFARQLPLLFSHIQTLLKLNMRQANELDSYSALLHVIHIVSTTGQSIFTHTQAFETFIEIFLNSFAAHSTRSRQWESILDRLTNLMQAYLNWNPQQAMKLVERNKNALFNIRRLYDLLSLREFMDFVHIFRF